MACAIRPSNVRVYQFHHFRRFRRAVDGHLKNIKVYVITCLAAEPVSNQALADRELPEPESVAEPVSVHDP